MIQLGPLQALDTSPTHKGFTVVLFHGYGADAFDLSTLADEISLPNTRWIFPQGPLTVPIGGGFAGRAWFPIDIDAHERAIATGSQVDYSQSDTKRMVSAREKAVSLIEATGVPINRIVLGGFSQGSMLALELALALKERPAGLVLLSGTLVDEVKLRQDGRRLKGLPYFQSHGERDLILPYLAAQRLHVILEDLGWDGHLATFPGGHEIPMSVLEDLGSFLQAMQGRE